VNLPLPASARPIATCSLLLALVLLAVPAGRPVAQELPPQPEQVSAGPLFAVEDTIPVPSALLPVQVVTAPRVTLDEILRRVAEGEARRDSLMKDQTFTMLAALTYLEPGKGGAPSTKRQWESATRVYRKKPDLVRTVPLKSKSEFKDDDGASVQVGPGMGEELVTFAFQPRTRTRFHFRILERHLVGDRVVYVIGFVPRSKLDNLPTGRAWIDTKEFVIVRQEFWYRDRSPSPLFFKSIDSCVIERAEVDDRWWVMSRVLARVQVTSLARFLARLGKEKLSPTVDFTLSLRDWEINRGLDDSLFAVEKKK
jgi:hypothetical protein